MSTPTTNGDDGRDRNGRFTKGNPGGPGNPYARRVAELRTALLETVGNDGLAEIVRGLVTAATGGDVAAAKLVLSYTLGKPTEAVDPDATLLHEQELTSRLKATGSVELEMDEATRSRIRKIVAKVDGLDEDEVDIR